MHKDSYGRTALPGVRIILFQNLPSTVPAESIPERPKAKPSPDSGPSLFSLAGIALLIGGDSRHFRFSNADAAQLAAAVRRSSVSTGLVLAKSRFMPSIMAPVATVSKRRHWV